jgi:hypothetical protein
MPLLGFTTSREAEEGAETMLLALIYESPEAREEEALGSMAKDTTWTLI